MRQFFAYVFLVVGIIFITVSIYMLWLRFTPHTFQPNSTQSTLGSYPVALRINGLHINLPIYPATLEGKNWKIANDGVAFLSSTSIPGKKGNSVLYGHDWPGLLGPLVNITPNQPIEVVFGNGQVKRFTVVNTQVVTPDQNHILNQTSDIRLTLYTCTGFLDSKRFVVTAIPNAL